MTFGLSMSYSSSKTRASALEKLKQNNAAKLEMETKKMEERIQSLKEKMLKEKEERERQGGTIWASGKTNLSQKPNSSKRTNTKKSVNKASRKIKVLADGPIDLYMQKPPTKSLHHDVINDKPCGQCEEMCSVWICLECSENYCDTCYNQFHQKGALRKHTRNSLKNVGTEKVRNKDSSSTGTILPIRSHGATTESSVDANETQRGTSIFDGTYDEEESAASFARALQEWRNQGKETKPQSRDHVTVADTSSGTNEEIPNDKKEVRISFHNSMSYGERLYLRKGRKDPSIITREYSENIVKEEGMKKYKESGDSTCDDEMKDSTSETDSMLTTEYRDMIQGLVTGDDNYTVQNGNVDLGNGNGLEISEICDSGDMNTNENEGIFIVEDGDNVVQNSRPVSRHGCVSIQEMASSGFFTDPSTLSKDCQNEVDYPHYVSPSLTSKPFSIPPRAHKQSNRPSSSGGRRKLSNKKRQKRATVHHAWKPKPKHKDMSQFFLAGVETIEDAEKASKTNNDNTTQFSNTEYSLSKGNLPTVWNPGLSFADVVNKEDEYRALMDSTQSAMTQINIDDQQNEAESCVVCPTRESDEDNKVFNASSLDFDDFGTGNQDEDDQETLDDLAWELASTTGRLTRCEDDMLSLESDDQEDTERFSPEFSLASTLERSDSVHESIMDDFEEMERKCMEEDI